LTHVNKGTLILGEWNNAPKLLDLTCKGYMRRTDPLSWIKEGPPNMVGRFHDKNTTRPEGASHSGPVAV
jgi:hypothetical protein